MSCTKEIHQFDWKVSKFQKLDPSEKIGFRWIGRLSICWHKAKWIFVFLFFHRKYSNFYQQNVLWFEPRHCLSLFIVHSILDFNRGNTLVPTALQRRWENPIRMSLTSYFCINTRWMGRVLIFSCKFNRQPLASFQVHCVLVYSDLYTKVNLIYF